ncbi:MAG: MaoC family dehydratase N-terminal domain-containing protein [Phenylobacterium sp.]|nr:MaoC family dehydratase N-terminal domain-containing protein [Phenylobacterium sp.]
MAANTFPVEFSHILMFARSVGDENPVYCDPQSAASTEAGGIIAPPTFVEASAQFDPDYFLRPKPSRPWFGSGRNPTGTPPHKDTEAKGDGSSDSGGLHAEQHYEYYRHVRPGDVLSVTTRAGDSWERESKRGGRLKFSESITEYRDQNGELVVMALAVGVVTERPADVR